MLCLLHGAQIQNDCSPGALVMQCLREGTRLFSAVITDINGIRATTRARAKKKSNMGRDEEGAGMSGKIENCLYRTMIAFVCLKAHRRTQSISSVYDKLREHQMVQVQIDRVTQRINALILAGT